MIYKSNYGRIFSELSIRGGEMMKTAVGYNNILDRLDCFVARISAIATVKGGSLSKNEYS